MADANEFTKIYLLFVETAEKYFETILCLQQRPVMLKIVPAVHHD